MRFVVWQQQRINSCTQSNVNESIESIFVRFAFACLHHSKSNISQLWSLVGANKQPLSALTEMLLKQSLPVSAMATLRAECQLRLPAGVQLNEHPFVSKSSISFDEFRGSGSDRLFDLTVVSHADWLQSEQAFLWRAESAATLNMIVQTEDVKSSQELFRKLVPEQQSVGNEWHSQFIKVKSMQDSPKKFELLTKLATGWIQIIFSCSAVLCRFHSRG